MDMDTVPAPLRMRLGADATAGLLHLLDLDAAESRADVIDTCTERFERRLAETMATVRVQIAQSEVGVRTEVTQMGAALRQEMADGRFELLRWSFLFWIGQVLALTGVFSVMIRFLR